MHRLHMKSLRMFLIKVDNLNLRMDLTILMFQRTEFY